MCYVPRKKYKIIWPMGNPWLFTNPLPLNVLYCFCAASHLFPYVKKRIQVISQSSTELNPIEVAIDEMSKKVSELNQLCTMEEVDMIRLQLKLQGSVSVKVSTPTGELHTASELWYKMPLEFFTKGIRNVYLFVIPSSTFIWVFKILLSCKCMSMVPNTWR